MFYLLTADLIVVLHSLFILFVLCGGLLVLRWHKLLWLHLPAVLWGVLVEFYDWFCPLTPVENHLRRMAGKSGYRGGFVEEYLLPLIYPMELTHEYRIVLGVVVLFTNLLIYGLAFGWRKRLARSKGSLR